MTGTPKHKWGEGDLHGSEFMLLLYFLGLLCVLFLPPTCVATTRALRDLWGLLETNKQQ